MDIGLPSNASIMTPTSLHMPTEAVRGIYKLLTSQQMERPYPRSKVIAMTVIGWVIIRYCNFHLTTLRFPIAVFAIIQTEVGNMAIGSKRTRYPMMGRRSPLSLP